MKRPDSCPECGSQEVRSTTRNVIPDGLIEVFVCGRCDWASDLRIGRPPADRSKNFTLRRLVGKSKDTGEGPGAD